MAGVGRALCGSPSPTPCPSRVTYSWLHSTASRQERQEHAPVRTRPCQSGSWYHHCHSPPWTYSTDPSIPSTACTEHEFPTTGNTEGRNLLKNLFPLRS